EFAKEFFVKQLKEFDKAGLELLYRKLTQHFLFNLYSISNEIDVHVSFETMNNRGKPLSHLELLKNRLIYLSTKFVADEFEKSKLRDAVNECWKSIYHNLGRNKDKPLDDDVFLNHHFVMYFGDIDTGPTNVPIYYIRRLERYWYEHYLLEEVFTV